MSEFREAIENATSEAPRKPNRPVRIALGMCGSLLLLIAGIVYRIQTNFGVLVIESEDPNVEVVVKQNGELISIVDTHTDSSIELNAGEYEVVLRGDDSNLSISHNVIMMRRAEELVVSVTRSEPHAPASGLPSQYPHPRQLENVDVPTDIEDLLLAYPSQRTGGSAWVSSRISEAKGAYTFQEISIPATYQVEAIEWVGAFWTHSGFIASQKVRHWEVQFRRVDSSNNPVGDLVQSITILPASVESKITRYYHIAGQGMNVQCWFRANLERPINIEPGNYGFSIHAVLEKKEGGWNWHASTATSPGCKQVTLELANVCQPKQPRTFAFYGVRDTETKENTPPVDGNLEPNEPLSVPSRLLLGRTPEAAEARRTLVRSSRQVEDRDAGLRLVDKITSFSWPIDSLRRTQISESSLMAAGGGNAADAPPEIVAIFGHANWRAWRAIEDLAYSSVHGTVIVGSDAGTITVFDARSGAVLNQFLAHDPGINSLVLSRDEALFATGGADQQLKVWDAKSFDLLFQVEGHAAGLSEVAFTPDSRQVVSAASDGTIRFWDLKTKKKTGAINADTPVWSLAVNPSTSHFVTGSDAGNVTLLDRKTRNVVKELKFGTERICSVSYSMDGCLLAVANQDGTVALLDAEENHSVVWKHQAKNPPVYDVSFASDQKTITIGSKYEVTVIDANSGDIVGTHQSHGNALRVCPIKSEWIAGWNNHWISKFSSTGKTLNQTAANRTDCALSLDGNRLAMVGIDRDMIQVWNLNALEELPRLRRAMWEERIGFVGRESDVITVGGNWIPKRWNVESGSVSGQSTKHNGWINCLDVASDGMRYCTGSFDCTARVWDIETSGEICGLVGHESGVNDVRFDSKGSRVATASDDHTIRVWNSTTGECLLRIADSNWPVTAAVFRPFSNELVATDDWNIAVYSLDSGERRTTIEGHRFAVQDVDVSPDGTQIASAGLDGTVRLWEASTGDSLRVFRLHPGCGEIKKVRFSPEGRHLITMNGNGTCYVLRLAEFSDQ